MIAILTGSACAVPVARHPVPASASAAQSLLIAFLPLLKRPVELSAWIAGENVGRPRPSALTIARAPAASCPGGAAPSRTGPSSATGRDLRGRGSTPCWHAPSITQRPTGPLASRAAKGRTHGPRQHG